MDAASTTTQDYAPNNWTPQTLAARFHDYAGTLPRIVDPPEPVSAILNVVNSPPEPRLKTQAAYPERAKVNDYFWALIDAKQADSPNFNELWFKALEAIESPLAESLNTI